MLSQVYKGKMALCGGATNVNLIKDLIVFHDGPIKKSIMLPTPSGDSEEAIKAVDDILKAAGIEETEALCLIKQSHTPEEVHKKIREADFIWVLGGWTEDLMIKWQEYDLSPDFLAALDHGAVLAGSSAGAICWAIAGYNDFRDGRYDFIDGCGFAKFLFGPHFNGEIWQEMGKRLETTTDYPDVNLAFGLSNDAALFLSENGIEFRTYTPEAFGYKFTKTAPGKWKKEGLVPNDVI